MLPPSPLPRCPGTCEPCGAGLPYDGGDEGCSGEHARGLVGGVEASRRARVGRGRLAHASCWLRGGGP